MQRLGDSERVLIGAGTAVCFLLLFFGLALGTALLKSPTADEPVHFLRGVVLGQTSDLHLQFEHAPLSHRLISVFVMTDASLPDVRELPSWKLAERTTMAHELVWESGLDVEKLIFLARLPFIFLGLLLGALIASWAQSWLGRLAMIVAVILFATSPNLLASSSLATTDLAAATFYFATAYVWWRYLRYSGRSWWLMTAVFLGLALSTKLTAVLLLPLLLVLALLYRRKYRSWWRMILSWLGLLPLALAILWLVYGLEFKSLDGFLFSMPAATYVRSWLDVLSHVQEGHQAYFLGELSASGWLTYFPVTLLIKTPAVSLILLLLGLIAILWQRDLWRTGFFLFLPVITLTAAAMISGLNIGYRHILPSLPFLMVIASASLILLHRQRFTSILLFVALGWTIMNSLIQFPDYLAYFNEFVGGSGRGHLYVGDSNLDWGQDLKLLAETIEATGGRWKISYAGVGDPVYYHIPPERLLDAQQGSAAFPAANPSPATYAISANHLQGLLPDQDMFDWFRRRDPDANLGGSILVYEIEEQKSGSWVAHCLDPAPILTPEEAEQLIDQIDLRHLYFDCRQSWVLPETGEQGWYVVPQMERLWFLEQMSDEFYSGLQLVYRHDASQFGPSYDVFYWSGDHARSMLNMPITEAALDSGKTVELPYSLNENLELRGYQVGGEKWFLEWQIKQPTDDALSLQAHLYQDENTPPVVADSLGFSSDQWQAGDRLLQRFDFSGKIAYRFMETAAYNFSTLETQGDVLRLPGH